MGFNPYSFPRNCELSMHAWDLDLLHKVEEITVGKVFSMSSNVTWHRGPNQCCFSSCLLQELKVDLRDQLCELELQREKISHSETKLEE
jgi:hypothetical protein